MKTLELKKSVFIFRWGAIRLQVHELSVMYSTNRSGVLSWPFCLQRTFAQVSQTLLSLYWTILIFCSSLFQLKVGSHRKDSCSCCFWRNLGTEDLVRFFLHCTLLHCTCYVNGYFRFVKNKLTGSILILFTFGFLARLTVIDSMVLKEKQRDRQYVNSGDKQYWLKGIQISRNNFFHEWKCFTYPVWLHLVQLI